MQIPIDRFLKVVDWLAAWLLPPPKPIGIRLFGYAVTWLDVFVWGIAAVGGAALSLYYWHWLWFVATMASMIFAAMMFAWMF